ATLENSRALRVGLSLPAPRRPGSFGRGRHARVGGGVATESGLGRVRSYQRDDGGRAPHPRGGRAGLRRRASDARYVQGSRGKRACDRGLGRAHAGADSPRGFPARRQANEHAWANTFYARAALSSAATTAAAVAVVTVSAGWRSARREGEVA